MSADKYLIDWELRDKVTRLTIAREAALRRRGIRWAAPRDNTDGERVHQLRKLEITKEAARSHIDKPQPFWKVNSKRKEKV